MVSLCICFPGGTFVTTRQGVKQLDELLQGEEVLTLSKQGQKWTQFYTWGHIQRDLIAEFVQLKVQGGEELQISEEHLLFVEGKNGKRVAKKAGKVVIGDKLYYFNQDSQRTDLLSVEEVGKVQAKGVYAPFTMSGDFLANRFAVTCYANVSNFKVAHAALYPLRTWYKVRQEKKDLLNKEGIHLYADKLMKFRELITTSPFARKVVIEK